MGAAETGEGGEPADQRDGTAQDGGPAERGEGTTEEAPGGTDRDGRGEDRQRAPNLSFRFPYLGKNFPEPSWPVTKFVCRNSKIILSALTKTIKLAMQM